MLPDYNGKQDCLVPLANEDIEEMKAHYELFIPSILNQLWMS